MSGVRSPAAPAAAAPREERATDGRAATAAYGEHDAAAAVTDAQAEHDATTAVADGDAGRASAHESLCRAVGTDDRAATGDHETARCGAAAVAVGAAADSVDHGPAPECAFAAATADGP